MANVKLQDLTKNSIIGANLFHDSESFMQELSENELSLQGGKAPKITARLSIFCRPILPTPIVGGGPVPFDPQADNTI